MVDFRNLKKEPTAGKTFPEKQPEGDQELDFSILPDKVETTSKIVSDMDYSLDEAEPDIEVLYNQASEYVQQAMEFVRAKKLFSLDQGLDIMQRIVETLSIKNQPFMKIIPADNPVKFVVTHSVNVALYAVKMAVGLNLSQNRQIEIGMAGLLHDIGMAVIPERIIYKKERLTEEEFKILKERPVYAYNILKAYGSDYGYLAEVALQVYEKLDGSGYPKGLKGEDIHEYAQIIGLVDMYEAMIHSRPQREKFLHFVAVKEIIKTGKNQFRRKYLKALLNVFSIFPVNSYVRLNSNAIGRIIETYPDQPMRPSLEIEFDSENRRILSKRIVDLRENSLLYIADSLSEEEVLEISAAAELVDRPEKTELDEDTEETEEDTELIGEQKKADSSAFQNDTKEKKTYNVKFWVPIIFFMLLAVLGVVWQLGLRNNVQPEEKPAIVERKPIAAEKMPDLSQIRKVKIPSPGASSEPAVKESEKAEPYVLKEMSEELENSTTAPQFAEPVPDVSNAKELQEKMPTEQKITKPLYPFSIQLASYRTLEAAEKGREFYVGKGILPYWVKVDLGNSGIWYRLFAGYFENLEKAEQLIKTYKLEGVAAKKTAYSVFIDSFSDDDDLTLIKSKLENLGYSPYSVQWNHLHDLYVGAFFTMDGAKDKCIEMLSKGISCKAVKR